jgi:hypothetical protein
MVGEMRRRRRSIYCYFLTHMFYRYAMARGIALPWWIQVLLALANILFNTSYLWWTEDDDFQTLQAYHLLYQPKDFNEYDDSIQSTTIRTIKHVVIMIISIVLFFCIVNDILFLWLKSRSDPFLCVYVCVCTYSKWI